jgi:predicted MFS family arabinose efflux permease
VYMVLNQTSAIFILPVELIHGLAFALTWAAGLENSKRIAPTTNKSTFVSIFCTLYNNVGGFLGTYVGGKIYQDYGHIYLWIFCILLLLVSILSFVTSTFLESKHENRTET